MGIDSDALRLARAERELPAGRLAAVVRVQHGVPAEAPRRRDVSGRAVGPEDREGWPSGFPSVTEQLARC